MRGQKSRASSCKTTGKPPFTLEPYPFAKRFAVTFVDDTDGSTRENTEPVYDLLASLGIRGTKTVWPNPQRRTSAFRQDLERPVENGELSGSTLENPDYLDFILKLKQNGFEIALHNVSAGNSRRDEIIAGLERFRRLIGLDPELTAFHQTNLDNLYCGAHKLDLLPFRLLERLTHRSRYEGHLPNTPHFWGDLIQATVKFVRLPFHSIPFTNTLRLNPSMPFHDPARPFVNYWFASSDGADRARFVQLLSPSRIAALKRHHGGCVIYTHFSKGFLSRHGHSVRVHPEFLQTMHELAGDPDAWFPTASEYLNYALALRRIELKQAGRRVTLINRAGHDLTGLTIRLGSSASWTPLTTRCALEMRNGAMIIDHLRPNERCEFHSSAVAQHHHPAEFFDGIPRSERWRIELANYLGVVCRRTASK